MQRQSARHHRGNGIQESVQDAGSLQRCQGALLATLAAVPPAQTPRRFPAIGRSSRIAADIAPARAVAQGGGGARPLQRCAQSGKVPTIFYSICSADSASSKSKEEPQKHTAQTEACLALLDTGAAWPAFPELEQGVL